jgi:hypothetical protein
MTAFITTGHDVIYWFVFADCDVDSSSTTVSTPKPGTLPPTGSMVEVLSHVTPHTHPTVPTKFGQYKKEYYR